MVPGPTEPAPSPPGARPWIRVLVAVALLAAGAWLARRSEGRLDPDGIALMALAGHVRAKRFGLATSDTWGPLVPLLMAGAEAARISMLQAGRALLVGGLALYVFGADRLLARLCLPAPIQIALLVALGLPAAAAAAGPLSTGLPLAACFAWALAVLVRAGDRPPPEREQKPAAAQPAEAPSPWSRGSGHRAAPPPDPSTVGLPPPPPKPESLAGALLTAVPAALGVLVEPSALLPFLGLFAAVALARLVGRDGPAGAAAGEGARRVLALALILAPWLAFSGRLAGAFVPLSWPRLALAAEDPELVSPTAGLRALVEPHSPRSGRISAWESPREVRGELYMPGREPGAWTGQAWAALDHFRDDLGKTRSLDPTFLGLLALVAVPVLALRRPRSGVGWRDLLPAMLVAGALAAGAPASLLAVRAPGPLALGLVAGLGILLARLAERPDGKLPGANRRLVEMVVQVVGCLGPLLAGAWAGLVALRPVGPDRVEVAQLAAKLGRSLPAPVLSWSALPGSSPFAGLALAHLLANPWLGASETPADLELGLALGAGFVVAEGARPRPGARVAATATAGLPRWLVRHPRLELLASLDLAVPGPDRGPWTVWLFRVRPEAGG